MPSDVQERRCDDCAAAPLSPHWCNIFYPRIVGRSVCRRYGRSRPPIPFATMSDPNSIPPVGSSENEPLIPAADAAKPASWWEDYIDIFYTPSTVFARRAMAGFGVPMLVVTVLIGVIFIITSGALQPVMDGDFARGAAAAMRKNPQITAEMMQKSKDMTEKFSKIGVFIILPVSMFLIGLVLWIVGKFFDSKASLSQSILIASFAWMPRVVESVVNGVQGLLLDPAMLNGRTRLALGVGRFFDPDVASPMLLAIIGRIDVFTIWVTVLLAIGLAVLGKVPRTQAIIAGVIMWIIGALPAVLGAARAM
jgi:hypothetical protein